MYSLFDLIDSAEQEKTIQEQPKEVIYQEHSQTTFHPDLAEWKAHEFMPELKMCEVLGVIPDDIYSPIEGRNNHLTRCEWEQRQKVWSTYVMAISDAFVEKEITTYWVEACNKLKTAREAREPIHMKISDYNCERFVDLEVIEYISATEGGISND